MGATGHPVLLPNLLDSVVLRWIGDRGSGIGGRMWLVEESRNDRLETKAKLRCSMGVRSPKEERKFRWHRSLKKALLGPMLSVRMTSRFLAPMLPSTPAPTNASRVASGEIVLGAPIRETLASCVGFCVSGSVVPPEQKARLFGAVFIEEKRRVFTSEIEAASNSGQWERKGSSIFHQGTYERFPQQIRVFNSLVWKLRSLGGNLFYYADEKPLGTSRQTALNTDERETAAMQEALNRLARRSESQNPGQNLIVMIDQINENQGSARMQNMYGHILGRASSHAEMKRIIEPPMHVDSVVSAATKQWGANYVRLLNAATEPTRVSSLSEAWMTVTVVCAKMELLVEHLSIRWAHELKEKHARR